MKARLYSAANYREMPWKNGAGTTTEVLRNSAESNDVFEWRVSIADVNEDGPFSVFQGYQRIITVLDGDGMVLSVDAQKSPVLEPFQPFSFDGGGQTTCQLTGSPLRDFNLMYRRDKFKARLQWHTGPQSFISSARNIILFNASAIGITVNCQETGHFLHMENQDTVHFSNVDEYPLQMTLQGNTGPVCVIELDAL